MKKYIKKLITLFVFAFLFTGSSAFASNIWNNGSQGPECPDINIASGTNGWGNPCWTGTNINVQPGSTVSVKIYYHNASGNPGVIATNTHIKVIAPTGSSTSQSFTGQILSPQGNLYTTGVTANVSPAQTLTYSSTTWYVQNSSGTLTQTPLLNGQSGSEVIGSSGLYIGNIVSGWTNGQGAVVVNFIVGNSTPPPQNCSISNFTANPTSIQSGGSSTLTWNTNNCTSVSISPLSYQTPLSGSQAVYPTYTTTYILTAYGSSGTQQTQSVTVSVSNYQNNCYINSFTSSPTYINSGGSSFLLSWGTSSGCTSGNISPTVGSLSNIQYGTYSVYPTYTTTYTLTAYGNTGSPVTQSVTVTVNNNQYNNCSISYFTASPNSINYGGVSTLSWSTSNCTSASITNIGSVNTYGSQIVYPTYTTTYTLTAYGSGNYYSTGSQTQSVTVNVNNYVPPPTPIYNTCAVTGVVTNIGQNSATLNGLVTNSSTYNGNTYFEYGTDVVLGSQTTARYIGSNTTFSETLTGLSPKTIYFYRLVSNCGNGGISRGSIEIFQTSGTTTTTIIRQGTTVIGTESPIMLKIENRYQSFRVGDSVDYTITYKNISNRTLTHPVLQVILPKGIAFLNSSRGTYSSDTYTVTVSLEDLVPNVEGIVYVQGRVDSIDSGNAQIVTTALLVYTAKNGAQENAMAYVLNNPIVSSGFGLGAAALFGSMFGIGILGWMILLILILLAILLFRKIYRKQ